MLKVSGMTLLNGVRVSCELARGELKVLQGPNGAGKSLFLRSLALLNSAAFESYVFDGADVHSLIPQEFRRKVLYVPPVPLDTAGTVAKFFTAPWQFAVSKEQAPESSWVEMLKNEGFWKREFHLLSSGEKQYVQLIRAYSMKAQILMLDESMGHMDSARRDKVERLLKEKIASGGSAIVITHDGLAVARLDAKVCQLADLAH